MPLSAPRSFPARHKSPVRGQLHGHPLLPRTHRPSAKLRQGAVRTRNLHSKNSQAHPGVTPLNPLTHRNVGYQPLPHPIGLAPYHYSLTDNFPDIAKNISSAKEMTLHIFGDSGGVQDASFKPTSPIK